MKELYPILDVVNIFLIYATSPSIVLQITTTLNFDFYALFVSYCIQAFRNVTGALLVVYTGHSLFQKRRELLHCSVHTLCGSEFNCRQETMVMGLWLRREGAAQFRAFCAQLLSILQ